MSDPQNCPECEADFQGAPIPEKSQHMYGGKTHFSRRIGIEITGVYDGVLIWMCPDCGHMWPRFERDPSGRSRLHEAALRRIAKALREGDNDE